MAEAEASGVEVVVEAGETGFMQQVFPVGQEQDKPPGLVRLSVAAKRNCFSELLFRSFDPDS